MPRVYTRKFDYDDARSRYAAGETIGELAREYGVSWARVQQVVVPEVGARANAKATAYNANGICPECGDRASRAGGQHLCRRCDALAQATTVRDLELQCLRCRDWKPDEDFPHNRREKYARRGRHTSCRPCLTIAKREWRSRNAEKQRAYDRDYKRRRRAGAKA